MNKRELIDVLARDIMADAGIDVDEKSMSDMMLLSGYRKDAAAVLDSLRKHGFTVEAKEAA